MPPIATIQWIRQNGLLVKNPAKAKRLIVDFLRRGWFWLWIVMLVPVVLAFSWNGLLADPAGIWALLLVVAGFLFVAFTSRFLFTGRWRRDR
jgi:hypothetical protein